MEHLNKLNQSTVLTITNYISTVLVLALVVLVPTVNLNYKNGECKL